MPNAAQACPWNSVDHRPVRAADGRRCGGRTRAARIVVVVVAVVALALGLVAALAAVADAPPPPAVSFVLASSDVFVGEMPVVRATVTAPREGTVRVVKSTRAHLGDFFRADLLSGDRRVPGGPPHERRADEPSDFTPLERGKTVQLSLPILSRPPKSGTYSVHVTLRPTPLSAATYEATLALEARELERRDVLETIPVRLPPETPVGNDHATVELLKVSRGAKADLFYRRAANGDLVLNRLAEIDPKTDVRCEARNVNGPKVAGTIHVTLRRGDAKSTLTVDYFTGDLPSEDAAR